MFRTDKGRRRPIPAFDSREALEAYLASEEEEYREALFEFYYEDPRSLAYNAQCIMGHVFRIPERSELEERAIRRMEQGFIDALVVHSIECPDCTSHYSLIDRTTERYLTW